MESEPEAYYGFAVLSRFLDKYSSTLMTECSLPDSILMNGAIMSPGGDRSLFLVNLSHEELYMELSIKNTGIELWYLHQVTAELANQDGFSLSPETLKGKKHLGLTLSPNCTCTLTNKYPEP